MYLGGLLPVSSAAKSPTALKIGQSFPLMMLLFFYQKRIFIPSLSLQYFQPFSRHSILGLSSQTLLYEEAKSKLSTLAAVRFGDSMRTPGFGLSSAFSE